MALQSPVNSRGGYAAKPRLQPVLRSLSGLARHHLCDHAPDARARREAVRRLLPATRCRYSMPRPGWSGAPTSSSRCWERPITPMRRRVGRRAGRPDRRTRQRVECDRRRPEGDRLRQPQGRRHGDDATNPASIPEHIPSAHRRYAEWTPARLMREAGKISDRPRSRHRSDHEGEAASEQSGWQRETSGRHSTAGKSGIQPDTDFR